MKLISDVLYYTGAIGLHNKLYPRRNVVILCSHEGKYFRNYVNYLSENCKIISLGDFFEIRRSNATFPENAVVLTFDDGYMSNYTDIYPILKRYKMPATIFLTVNMIGTENVFSLNKLRFAIMNTKKQFFQMDAKRYKLNTPRNRERTIQKLCQLLRGTPEQIRDHKVAGLITSLDVKVDEKKLPHMLTWKQVKEMSDGGITFGAHTLNHSMLTRMSLEDARKEIADSKRVLEEKIQKSVNFFSYPYGTKYDFNEDIRNIIRDSGYACALTFIRGYNDQNTDPFTLKRFSFRSNVPDLAFMLSSLRWKLCQAFTKIRILR
jgi:hypothetical protein